MTNTRVLTEQFVRRLALQNRLIRHVRTMGCTVVGVLTDETLAIEVAPQDGDAVSRMATAVYQNRTAGVVTRTAKLEGGYVSWRVAA